MTATINAKYTTRAGALVTVEAQESEFLGAHSLSVTATCSGCKDHVHWSTSPRLTGRQAQSAADHWAQHHANNCHQAPAQP